MEAPPATHPASIPEGVQAPQDGSPALSSSTMSPTLPRKLRRSYIGSFFASFSISSDEHAHDGAHHNEEAQPALLAQRLGKKKFDRQMSLGGTLASWMLRTHVDNQVVPLDLVEQQPTEPTSQSISSSQEPLRSAEPEVVVIKHRRTANVAYQ